MIYFLNLILFFIFTIVVVTIYRKDKELKCGKNLAVSACCVTLMCITGVVFIMETFNIANTYATIDANIAAWEQNYKTIVYQLENNMYEENSMGLRDLMERVELWNSDLAMRKELTNNFWIGIYYPDVYDQFNFIDLSEYNLIGN